MTHHTLYTWSIHTVAFDRAESLLNRLTSGDFEVFSTAVIKDGLQVIVVARQHTDVSARIEAEKERAYLSQLKFIYVGNAPQAGLYAPKCGHPKQRFNLGDILFCEKCGVANVPWALLPADEPAI